MAETDPGVPTPPKKKSSVTPDPETTSNAAPEPPPTAADSENEGQTVPNFPFQGEPEEGEGPPKTAEEADEFGSGFEQRQEELNEEAQDSDLDDLDQQDDQGGEDGVPGVQLNGPLEDELQTVGDVRAQNNVLFNHHVPVVVDPFDPDQPNSPFDQGGFVGTSPEYQDPNSQVRTPAVMEVNSGNQDTRDLSDADEIVRG